jgi:hypothetical protein
VDLSIVKDIIETLKSGHNSVHLQNGVLVQLDLRSIRDFRSFKINHLKHWPLGGLATDRGHCRRWKEKCDDLVSTI